MKNLDSIICFVMAGGAIFIGVASKGFYGGGPGRLAVNNPVPKWFGRLWFFGFAAVMVYVGIKAMH